MYRIVNNLRTSKVVEFYAVFVNVTSAAVKAGTVVSTLLPIIESDRFSNMDHNLTHGPPYSTKQ